MFSFFRKKPPPARYVVPEGSKNISLEEIDTSYWKANDKAWMIERGAAWPTIESMLCNHKPTVKARNIVKAYFLKGKMPDWKALEGWSDQTRHVDLLVFLWLHPSRDEFLLRELRDLYIHSDLIVRNDIGFGLEMFLRSMPIWVSTAAPATEIDFPDLDGHTELLFRVLLGDPIQKTFEVSNPSIIANQRRYDIREPGLNAITWMASWLNQPKMLPIHHEFLYQFDRPLEWWYDSVKDVDFFNVKKSRQKRIPSFIESLACIHRFDTEKEGETCRTAFARKIRKILDEREFTGEIKQMWREACNR